MAWVLIAIAMLALQPLPSAAQEQEQFFLCIEAADGHVLAALPLPDRSFSHVFLHSFHLTPVEERFVVEQGAGGSAVMHLFELRYQSEGVGMPADGGNGYRLEDGHFVVAMNRTFTNIPIMVSIVQGHGIVVGGLFHPFTEWAHPEELIVLRALIGSTTIPGG